MSNQDAVKILGLDEAGRGPVLGPLVVAGVWASPTQLRTLIKIGLKDSKQLSPKQRLKILTAIKRLRIMRRVVRIQPRALDRHNINSLTLKAFAQIINSCRVGSIYVDAPVPPSGIAKFVVSLKSKLAIPNLQIIAENKADVLRPVVSAASVVAKIERGRCLKQIQGKYRRYGKIGSGYPADSRTIEFLNKFYQRHGRWPKEARKSWATLRRLALNINPLPPTFKRAPYGVALLMLVVLLLATTRTIGIPPTVSRALEARPAPLGASPEVVLVTKVIDGDTITIEGGRRVRLLAIDTPEIDEPCYIEAKKRLEQLIFNKRVRLESDVRDTDKYGRLLRFIFLAEQNVNLTLIDEGFAVAYFFDNQRYKVEVQKAEEYAKNHKRGCRWSLLP